MKTQDRGCGSASSLPSLAGGDVHGDLQTQTKTHKHNNTHNQFLASSISDFLCFSPSNGSWTAVVAGVLAAGGDAKRWSSVETEEKELRL